MTQAPPVDALLDYDPEDRPSWPKVVGIISIVWGGLGMTCACWDVVSPFTSEQAAKQATTGTIALSAVGMAWGVLLIASGILCLQRAYAARWAHLVYAIGSLLLSVAGIIIFQNGKEAMLDAIVQGIRDGQQGQGGPSPESMRSTISISMTVMLVVMTVIQSIWPIFCLFWFGLIKRTRDSFHRMAPPPVAG